MKYKKLTLFGIIAIIASVNVFSQTATTQTTPATTDVAAQPIPAVVPVTAAPAEQKVTFYGFVKHEMFYNTRRSSEAREDVINIYPLDLLSGTALTEANKGFKDQNGFASFHMTSVFSRLGLKFAGAKAFGANATGMLEGDFMGPGNGSEDIFRLRHAYVELDWTTGDKSKTGAKLLIGQYWNPMFIAACFPTVASTTTGIPFNPFGWVPQVRLTYQMGEVSLLAMAYSERALQHVITGAGTGYSGNTATEATRYSGMPNFHLQVQYQNKMIHGGIGADISTIRPNLVSSINGNFADSNVNSTNLTSVSFFGFLKITTDPITFKAYVISGNNFDQYVGMGGFAMYKGALTDKQFSYSAQNTLSMWFEAIGTSSKNIQPALWVGYMTNNGTADNLTGKVGTTFVGRGITNARTFTDFMRIAPRVDFLSGKFKFSIEYSYDAINFANTDIATYKAAATPFTYNATNNRINFATVYNF